MEEQRHRLFPAKEGGGLRGDRDREDQGTQDCACWELLKGFKQQRDEMAVAFPQARQDGRTLTDEGKPQWPLEL